MERIDIVPLYNPDDEIRKPLGENCPYLAYYRCLDVAFGGLNGIKSVCDVGCATGHLIANVKSNYSEIDIKGIEYFSYHKFSSNCRVKKDIEIWDIRDLWEDDKKYDIVNCSEMAEHIDKPFAAIMMMNLKKLTGKYLVMTWAGGDPNHQHFNPLEYDAYVSFVSQFGFEQDHEKTKLFLAESEKHDHFNYWWRSSLIVWKHKE
jgi:hypothetical protein